MPYLLLLFIFLSACGKSSGGTSNVSTIQGLTSEYHLPSLASMMIKNDVTVEEHFNGVRKFGTSDPVQSTDAYHLGSCTKAMTATLAAILIEEGKLNWDSTLGSLVTDINIHPAFKDMRFDLLLVHRAGLNDYEDALFSKIQSMNGTDGKELVLKTLLERGPAQTPGSTFLYSNYGYIIAGRIMERLTGKTWEELLKTKIFDPLDMKTCGFGPAPLVWGHIRNGSAIIPRFSDNPVTFGPAGRVYCSLGDWGKFLTIHMKGFKGKSNLVTVASFKKLHSTYPANDSSYTYGAWNLNYRSWAKGMTLSHAGSNTMNYAKVWIAPEVNSIIMSATNIGGDGSFEGTEKAIGNLINTNLD